MKKTLLVAAATLAAGVLASQAQVYSQNIVGYYNVNLPASQFSMISGQLLNADGSNSVNNVLSTGLASGTATVLFWNGAGFDTYTYYDAADASPSPAGFYNNNDFSYSTNLLAPGAGAFVYNGDAATVTVVGTVPQGTFTNTVAPGFNIYSINAPVSTNIDSSLVNFPAVSTQDTLLLWTGDGFENYTYYDAADASPSPAGWYDNNTFNDYSTDPTTWTTVGQAFFVYHTGSSATWTNTLSF